MIKCCTIYFLLAHPTKTWTCKLIVASFFVFFFFFWGGGGSSADSRLQRQQGERPFPVKRVSSQGWPDRQCRVLTLSTTTKTGLSRLSCYTVCRMGMGRICRAEQTSCVTGIASPVYTAETGVISQVPNAGSQPFRPVPPPPPPHIWPSQNPPPPPSLPVPTPDTWPPQEQPPTPLPDHLSYLPAVSQRSEQLPASGGGGGGGSVDSSAVKRRTVIDRSPVRVPAREAREFPSPVSTYCADSSSGVRSTTTTTPPPSCYRGSNKRCRQFCR